MFLFPSLKSSCCSCLRTMPNSFQESFLFFFFLLLCKRYKLLSCLILWQIIFSASAVGFSVCALDMNITSPCKLRNKFGHSYHQCLNEVHQELPDLKRNQQPTAPEMQCKHHVNEDSLNKNNSICNTCCKQAWNWRQSRKNKSTVLYIEVLHARKWTLIRTSLVSNF